MNMICRFFSLILVICSIAQLPASANSLTIEGWPIGDTDVLLSPWIGRDPLIGRLSCPSVLRLELDHKRNDALLLRNIPSIVKTANGENWTFSLRPNLRWWSGESVSAGALSIWLKDALNEVIRSKYISGSNLRFQVRSESNLDVLVEWTGSPGFGPYILSGRSLFRANKEGIECVGLYSFTQTNDSILMTLNKGYSAKYNQIHLPKALSSNNSKSSTLSFLMANKISKTTETSISNSDCKLKIDIPIVTVIAWNHSSILAGSSNLRQALTMATPRGEILRTALGDFGTLISAPILRFHPGYSTRTLVRPYNLEKASQIFEHNGFKQSHIGQPRRFENGQNIVLRIGRKNEVYNLLEKMISDSFASLGIEVQFFSNSNPTEKFDGNLLNVKLPWPSEDLSLLGLNGGENTNSYSENMDVNIDQSIKNFSLDLTQLNPDFHLLQEIHERWYDFEPWTILMSHQACVIGRAVKLPKTLNVLDSDWLRKIVLGEN